MLLQIHLHVGTNTSACCHLEVDISHVSSAQLLAERRDLQDIIVKIVVVKFSVGTDIIISSSQNYEKYHDQNRVLMPPTTCCQECDLFNGQESDKNLGILPSSYSGHHHDHHHSFHRPVKQYRRYTCLAAQQGVWSLPSARQWNISVSQGAQIIRSLREALATWRGSQNLKNGTQSYNMENGWYRLSFKIWTVGCWTFSLSMKKQKHLHKPINTAGVGHVVLDAAGSNVGQLWRGLWLARFCSFLSLKVGHNLWSAEVIFLPHIGKFKTLWERCMAGWDFPCSV